MKKIDYSKGMKVCITCDWAIFMGLQNYHCPCCNKNLRTKRSIMAKIAGLQKSLCCAATDYMRSSAVMPRTLSAFLKAIPNVLTRARRAILTSAFPSFSTGTFS